MPADHSKAHSDLKRDIFVTFGAHPSVRLMNHPTGFDEKRRIRYGLRGSADILGILAPSGRALAIEVKTGRGVLSVEQRAFRRAFERMGGLYVLARSTDDVARALGLG